MADRADASKQRRSSAGGLAALNSDSTAREVNA